MPTNFKLRELRIQIQLGVTLIVDVTTIDEVKELLVFLKEHDLLKEQQAIIQPNPPSVTPQVLTDDPQGRVELNAGIPSGSLVSKRILAFKDDVPQLLKPALFGNVTDAVLALAYAVETGLRSSKIPYEQFKSLFEAQSIKSGSSLALLLNNLKGSGYIDKKLYDTDRTISLTAKGSQRASEVLQSIAGKSE